jgi:carbohydrate-binding DOMON domain-containing protein
MRRYIAVIVCLFLIVTLFAASTAMVVGIFELKVITSNAGPTTSIGGQVILFEMEDPEGDDYGPGSYIYPTHDFFKPHKGLFDITKFVVSYDSTTIYFDTTFKEVANPLDAEEGFTHQLVDIYIHTGEDKGRTNTLRSGAGVRFAQNYPWNVYVRGGPWLISRVFSAVDDESSQGISKGIRTELLPDEHTIRIAVDKTLIGEPSDKWKYYVIVGSQDGFGPDEYRPVMEKATGWDFGGGRDDDLNPNVIDMLAAVGGKYSQESMLSSFDTEEGKLAVIYPVGPGKIPGEVSQIIIPVIAIGLTLFLTLIFTARRQGERTPKE